MSSSSVPLSTPEDQDGAKETPKIRYLSRREMLGLMGSTAIAVTLAGCGGEQSGSSSSPSAPNLPAGFTDAFTSRYIDTGELRLHAVIGGEGRTGQPVDLSAGDDQLLQPRAAGDGRQGEH